MKSIDYSIISDDFLEFTLLEQHNGENFVSNKLVAIQYAAIDSYKALVWAQMAKEIKGYIKQRAKNGKI